MSILVRRNDDDTAWVRWNFSASVEKTWTLATLNYADGRSEDVPVEPYTTMQSLDGNQLKNFFDQGIWTLEEIEAVGGRIANDFVVPEGKQLTGDETFVEDGGEINQHYEVEDIPPPPEPPTTEEKLAALGFTIAELRAALAE